MSNSGTFNASAGTVNLQGNLVNNATFTAGSGTMVFDGTTPQTLAGTLTFNNLTVDKTSGNLVSSNDLTVNGTLTLTSGDLDMASYTLTMGASATTAGNMDVIGAVKRASPGTGTAFSFGSQYTTLNFSVAPGGDVTVTMIKQAPSGLGTKYVKRRYFLTVPGGTATVRLHYRNGDLVGSPTESQLNLWRYDSVQGKWILQNITGSVTGTADANYLEKSGVSTFSEWGLAVEAAPTAVTLSSFTAAPATTDLILPGLALAVLGAIAGLWKLRRT